jgi:hypothetical protein
LAGEASKQTLTLTLRRKCKDVTKKAKGAIFFLQRKTELRDIDYLMTQLIDDDHNDGVDRVGKFNVAERRALALALIEMNGVADSSTSKRVILPSVSDRHPTRPKVHCNNGQLLEWQPVTSYERTGDYAGHKATKGFQKYFKAFVTNYVPQTNQTTGL